MIKFIWEKTPFLTFSKAVNKIFSCELMSFNRKETLSGDFEYDEKCIFLSNCLSLNLFYYKLFLIIDLPLGKSSKLWVTSLHVMSCNPSCHPFCFSLSLMANLWTFSSLYYYNRILISLKCKERESDLILINCL